MKRILLLSSPNALQHALDVKWAPDRKRLLVCLFASADVNEPMRRQAAVLGDTVLHLQLQMNPAQASAWLA